MARRRSKSWYISRLVRATGIVKDEVVNVSGGSADSDVAAIAELRRDADSEELQIQSIRTAIDSDYALFNAKIAAFNGLTDSDLTTVAKLRNDVDSDSLKIQALETTVNNLPTPSGGVSLTEVTDSDGREAISSPIEGDIAIQYGSSPGLNTGVTYDFAGGTVLSFDVPLSPSNYSSAEMTLTNATFAAAAQPGDVIVVQNSTIRYYVHPSYYNDQGTYNGTLIMAVLSVVNSTTLKVMFRNTFNFPAQSSSGYVNSDLYNYFGNPANPRGDIPSNALVAGPTVGNTFNYWSSKQWIGGVATLYRMFDSTILSAYGENPSGTPHVYNDDFTGSVTPLPYNQAKIYVYQDSDDLTNSGWKNTIASNDDVTTLQARVDSESAKVQTINGTVAALQNSINTLGGVSLTEVIDSDGREGISSPKEGDIAIQYSSYAGTYTGISHDFTVGGNRSQLWAYTVYSRSANSLTSSFGNGRFQWSNSTFDPVVQKGDVIVVENGFAQTTPGVNSGGVNYNSGYYGTFIFVCHTPQVGGSAPYYNIQAHGHVLSPSSIGFVLNSSLYSYFANAANPRGSVPASAQVVTSYMNSNNSSATQLLQGTVAKLYRFFDPATYADGYDNNGTADPYNGSNDATINALPYSKPEVYIYQDSDDLTPRGWKSPFISFDSDQVVAIINENVVLGSVDSDVAAIAALRRDADSDSIAIQSLRTSIDSDYALFNAKFALLNGLTDSDLTTVSNLRNDLDSESVEIRLLRRELDSDIANIPESTTNVTQRVYSFTSSQPTTTFSGNDDNGQTLSYSVGRIQVYLNGLLLTEGALKDYTATNGTSVVLTEATDSDDILTVAKFLGTPDDVITNKYIYKVSPAGNHTPFDSEFTGVDENGTTLSYTPGKIQVFLNGVLLQDSDDYTANNGSTITLLTAPDSEDVLVVYRYLGTQVAGFDSEQIVAIINENASTLPWVEKTSSVAVTAGQKIIVNTSTTVTLTLPASASLGDEIRIIDGTGTAGTNNITVARNGHNILGAASDLTINLNASGIGLVYYNASRGWILIEN